MAVVTQGHEVAQRAAETFKATIDAVAQYRAQLQQVYLNEAVTTIQEQLTHPALVGSYARETLTNGIEAGDPASAMSAWILSEELRIAFQDGQETASMN